jgi:hypothetical protein
MLWDCLRISCSRARDVASCLVLHAALCIRTIVGVTAGSMGRQAVLRSQQLLLTHIQRPLWLADAGAGWAGRSHG